MTQTTNRGVVAVVLNWNGWRDTIECLESLQLLAPPPSRIVVVDNGSTDDSVEQIRAWARGELEVKARVLESSRGPKPVVWVEYDRRVAEAGGVPGAETELEAAPPDQRLALIETRENLGFAGGMNVGIRYACARGADYVWLINNDSVVAPEALGSLVEAVKGRPGVGIAGPQELDYYEPGRVVDSVGVVRLWRGVIGGVARDLQVDRQGCADVELLSGFNLLVRCDAVRAVGLMDERFFLYCEDTEWCVRMRKKGWKLLHIPAARVWHKGSQSTGWGSPLMYYYTTRNQLRLFSMHFPYAIPAALVRSTLRALKLARYRRWSQCWGVVRGCWDWMRGKLGMAHTRPLRRSPDAA